MVYPATRTRFQRTVKFMRSFKFLHDLQVNEATLVKYDTGDARNLQQSIAHTARKIGRGIKTFSTHATKEGIEVRRTA